MADIKEIAIGNDIYIIRDQNAVKKAGDTLTGGLYITNTPNPIQCDDPYIDTTQTPANTLWSGITFFDKNHIRYGKIEGSAKSASESQGSGRDYTFGFNASRYVNGTPHYAWVIAWVTPEGKRRYDPVQIISTWYDGYKGYRVWSDGYCEQWGTFGGQTSNWASASASFHKTFKDTYYTLFVQGNWSSPESSSCLVTARSTTGFTATHANNYYSTMPSYWKACGILADDQY